MNENQQRRVEVILDALAYLNGAFDDPSSLAYRLKNPALIKSYSLIGKHETDENGTRVFSSHLAGYKANLYDLERKLTGTTRARITTGDPLSTLFSIYGITEPAGWKKLIRVVRVALNDESISEKMTLTSYLDSVV